MGRAHVSAKPACCPEHSAAGRSPGSSPTSGSQRVALPTKGSLSNTIKINYIEVRAMILWPNFYFSPCAWCFCQLAVGLKGHLIYKKNINHRLLDKIQAIWLSHLCLAHQACSYKQPSRIKPLSFKTFSEASFSQALISCANRRHLFFLALQGCADLSVLKGKSW